MSGSWSVVTYHVARSTATCGWKTELLPSAWESTKMVIGTWDRKKASIAVFGAPVKMGMGVVLAAVGSNI